MRLPRRVAAALAFDPAGVQVADGLRASVGVVLPLVVGTAVGHPAAGAQVAVGALPAGVASLTGTFAPPTGLILATTAGMTVTTFVGSLTAGHRPAQLVVLALLGLGAGLLVGLGKAATIVGVQAVVAFVVFGRYPGGVDMSALHAGWVLAGGLLQLALVHLLRAPRRLGPQRDAVAAAYDELARLARGALDDTPGVPAAAALAVAADVVSRRTVPGAEGADELRGLLDEAGRIRLELQALGSLGDDRPELMPPTRDYAAAVARSLEDIAMSVGAGRPPHPDDGVAATLADQLRESATGPAQRFMAARAAALVGQVRAAGRLAAALAGVRRVPLPRVGSVRGVMELRTRSARLRRVLPRGWRPDAAARRHAVRLAVLLPLADIIAGLLPWRRGYWVALSTVVVLKPDYAATVQRGIARVGGTAAGVVLGGVVIAGLHPHGVLLVVLIAALAWASYAVFSASFALYSFVLTGLVVLLVSTVDPRPLAAVADRGLDTLVGGAIALAGYLVWPTREEATLRSTTAALLDALADYAAAVLAGHRGDTGTDQQRLDAAAGSARRARAAAQASLERAMAEPTRLGADTQTAVGVLAATRRIVIALHSLRTTLQDSPEPVPVAELGDLADEVPVALRRLAHDGGELPDLRAAQQRLVGGVSADPTSAHERRVAVVAAHLDPLVDAIDTVAHLIRSEEAAA